MPDSLPPAPTIRGHEETAVFETSVVPRYLSFFAERILHEIKAGKDSRVIHLYCRSGYPDRELIEKLPNAHVHGMDPSAHAIELARAKALALVEARKGTGSNIAFDYRVVDRLPLSFPGGVFSHGFSMQAPSAVDPRRDLIGELARLVAPRGQALIAMPMRSSFCELFDLLRECALKYELNDLTAAVETAASLRPTEEQFKLELEAAGFEHVNVDMRKRLLRFEGGRAFFEDPITRLVILPELKADLGDASLPTKTINAVNPWDYVRHAIDKYWSDATFELTVEVGTATGRKPS